MGKAADEAAQTVSKRRESLEMPSDEAELAARVRRVNKAARATTGPLKDAAEVLATATGAKALKAAYDWAWEKVFG